MLWADVWEAISNPIRVLTVLIEGEGGSFLTVGAGRNDRQRLQPSNPAHPFTAAIEERVDAEAFPERGRPAQTPRFALPCLSQQGEDGVMRAGLGARGQQSEVADGVPVAVRHVVGQGGQEVSRRVAGHDRFVGSACLSLRTGFRHGQCAGSGAVRWGDGGHSGPRSRGTAACS